MSFVAVTVRRRSGIHLIRPVENAAARGSHSLISLLTDPGAITSSDYLLDYIMNLVSDSAGCIFDATEGNPNVSLEVGIAHTLPVNYLLTVSTRKKRTKAEREAAKEAQAEGEIKAIISDLQGKNRIEYKQYPVLKREVVRRWLNELPYMQRWNKFKKDHKIWFRTSSSCSPTSEPATAASDRAWSPSLRGQGSRRPKLSTLS